MTLHHLRRAAVLMGVAIASSTPSSFAQISVVSLATTFTGRASIGGEYPVTHSEIAGPTWRSYAAAASTQFDVGSVTVASGASIANLFAQILVENPSLTPGSSFTSVSMSGQASLANSAVLGVYAQVNAVSRLVFDVLAPTSASIALDVSSPFTSNAPFFFQRMSASAGLGRVTGDELPESIGHTWLFAYDGVTEELVPSWSGVLQPGRYQYMHWYNIDSGSFDGAVNDGANSFMQISSRSTLFVPTPTASGMIVAVIGVGQRRRRR